MVTNSHQTQDKGEISFWRPSALFLIFFAGLALNLFIGSLGAGGGLGPPVFFLLTVLLYVIVRPLAPKNLIVLPIMFAALYTLLGAGYLRFYMADFFYSWSLDIGNYTIGFFEAQGFFYGKSRYINPMTITKMVTENLWLNIKSIVIIFGIMLVVHYLMKTIRTKRETGARETETDHE